MSSTSNNPNVFSLHPPTLTQLAHAHFAWIWPYSSPTIVKVEEKLVTSFCPSCIPKGCNRKWASYMHAAYRFMYRAPSSAQHYRFIYVCHTQLPVHCPLKTHCNSVVVHQESLETLWSGKKTSGFMECTLIVTLFFLILISASIWKCEKEIIRIMVKEMDIY
jgi:hypothetical protein